jgi:hypothetical protein
MPTVFDELRVLLLKTQAFFDALVVGLSPSVPGSWGYTVSDDG